MTTLGSEFMSAADANRQLTGDEYGKFLQSDEYVRNNATGAIHESKPAPTDLEVLSHLWHLGPHSLNKRAPLCQEVGSGWAGEDVCVTLRSAGVFSFRLGADSLVRPHPEPGNKVRRQRV